MLKFTCNVRPIFLGVPENSLKERSTFGTYKKKVTCDRRSERGSNCTWPSMRGVLRDRSGSLEAFLLTSTEAHTGSNIYWCSRLCIYLLISCNRQLIKKKFTRSISLCAIECPYIIKKSTCMSVEGRSPSMVHSVSQYTLNSPISSSFCRISFWACEWRVYLLCSYM